MPGCCPAAPPARMRSSSCACICCCWYCCCGLVRPLGGCPGGGPNSGTGPPGGCPAGGAELEGQGGCRWGGCAWPAMAPCCSWRRKAFAGMPGGRGCCGGRPPPSPWLNGCEPLGWAAAGPAPNRGGGMPAEAGARAAAPASAKPGGGARGPAGWDGPPGGAPGGPPGPGCMEPDPGHANLSSEAPAPAGAAPPQIPPPNNEPPK